MHTLSQRRTNISFKESIFVFVFHWKYFYLVSVLLVKFRFLIRFILWQRWLWVRNTISTTVQRYRMASIAAGKNISRNIPKPFSDIWNTPNIMLHYCIISEIRSLHHVPYSVGLFGWSFMEKSKFETSIYRKNIMWRNSISLTLPGRRKKLIIFKCQIFKFVTWWVLISWNISCYYTIMPITNTRTLCSFGWKNNYY